MRAVLAAGALLGLAACTPQQCDPSQAGFFSGIGCAASGSYATRNQYQQVELSQQRAAAAQSRDQAQGEGARASQALVTRDQARRRLATVDQQNTRLRARLAAARTRGDVDRTRLDAAQAELDGLQSQRAALQGRGATDEDLRALEDHQRRLRDEVSGL
jgi:chromosome segregation ATPase